ncbi:MAG: hypothetical protein C0483_01295 [Pirellula sp.]|nr:hypothetical protein [Pirellula sp.]
MSTPTEAKKPASYYELMKLKPFEPDVNVIRQHFVKIVEQIRAKIAAEPTQPRWPAMLGEMTHAMLVLSDARRKNDYDASIGGKQGRDVRLMDLDKIVRARKVLDEAGLEKAQKFADTVNLDLHEAIINQKLATPETVMPLYAESIGLPYVQLSALTFDESLIATVPAVMARQNSFTPVLVDDDQVVIAAPRPLKPDIEDQLRLRFGKQLRQVICSKAAIDEAINKYYPREAAAAQMAAVPQTSSSGGGSSAAPAAGSSGAKPRLNKSELAKKKLKIGGIAGMMTAMVLVIGGTLFTDMPLTSPMLLRLGGLAVGAVVFAVTYLVVNE